MRPRNVERRPLRETGGLVDHDDDSNDSTVRCWLCGRPLTAESSVRLGVGPVCWAERMGGAA